MDDVYALGVYRADPSLKGKLRRRLVRLVDRKPARGRLDRPMVTFAFDDTPASAVRIGAPILESRGVQGTYYFCAGLAGQHGHMGQYATREDMLRVAQAGHEIACHTYSHLDCGQAASELVADDLELNAAMLSDWGVADHLTTFAYPYGDVGFPGKHEAAQRFALSRGLHHGLIEPGSDLNQAPSVGIEDEGGEAIAATWLERAAMRSAWLILFTHGVEDRPTPFGCSKDALARLLDSALARGFEVVTAAEGARRMGAELKAAA
jgi:peptidoglycan/xylan/chitin deacetylase (PgdA/CDA1 family)